MTQILRPLKAEALTPEENSVRQEEKSLQSSNPAIRSR